MKTRTKILGLFLTATLACAACQQNAFPSKDQSAISSKSSVTNTGVMPLQSQNAIGVLDQWESAWRQYSTWFYGSLSFPHQAPVR